MASISDADLPVGSHTITAAYTADSSNFAASNSDSTPLVIQADATSTTVTTAPDTLADFAQKATFSATVENVSDSAAPATPTGTVQFAVDGSPYGTPVDLLDGVASISDADIPVGSHSINAAYTPNSPDFAAGAVPRPHHW